MCNLEGPIAGKPRDEHLLTLLLPISLPLGTPAQGAQMSHNPNNHETGTDDEDISLF